MFIHYLSLVAKMKGLITSSFSYVPGLASNPRSGTDCIN
jgi:hypothetical protein